MSDIEAKAREELESTMAASYDMRTICEVLREIYWETTDEVIREKVLEATIMAKKMDRKLIENYNKKWYRSEEFYKKNPDSKEKAKQRRARALEEK